MQDKHTLILTNYEIFLLLEGISEYKNNHLKDLDTEDSKIINNIGGYLEDTIKDFLQEIFEEE